MAPAVRSQRLLQHLSGIAIAPRRVSSINRFPTFTGRQTQSCLFCQYRSQNLRARSTTETGAHTIRSYRSRSPAITPSGRRTYASIKTSATTPESNTTTPNTTTASIGPNGSSPDITNHYTIFPQSLPAGPPSKGGRFDIPLPDLRREFLRLQATIHPDKFPSGAAKQRAEALSARINEAYRTLSDPLLRAQYLLREWHGIDVTAEDGAAKEHALDAETLMEVMEVQEIVEEVSARGGEEAVNAIAELKRENERRVEECVRMMGRAFDAGDVEAARKLCVRLRFWYSVGEGLREWEPGRGEIRLVH